MKCFHCGRIAVYELRYSGHWVCRRHFIDLFERRVKKCIRQGRLLARDDTVLVGLSGSKESLSALKILHDILHPNPHAGLLAATVDDGMAKKRASVLREYCDGLGVEHHLLSLKGGKAPNSSLALRGGGKDDPSVLRTLGEFANKIGATKVVTGENLDDEITAAFMKMLSGEAEAVGSRGGIFKKIAGTSVPRLSVLRECLEEEVIIYAKLLKLPYLDNVRTYDRRSYNATARNLLDALEENHPGSKYQMLRSVDEFTSIMDESR
jgi:tRNA(Ile)-lysidine synthase TilS/MesJ